MLEISILLTCRLEGELDEELTELLRNFKEDIKLHLRVFLNYTVFKASSLLATTTFLGAPTSHSCDHFSTKKNNYNTLKHI